MGHVALGESEYEMTAINHTFATVAERGEFDTIIDVRSPSEFALDHIPGAINCPVLDDEERIRVGTLYKQESPFAARKVGSALVARNIARHIEVSFGQKPKNWKPLVYCWRGGQRSGSMTHILREVGWPAKRMQGGYKSWRQYVMEALQRVPPTLAFQVVAGPTGSAKTRILEALQRQGHQVLNLEELAEHKGSVLGALPGRSQPSQKLFETRIYAALAEFGSDRPVYVESESRTLGSLRLPQAVFDGIQGGHWLLVQAERAERVKFLLSDYAYFLEGEDVLRHLARLNVLCGNEQVARWCMLAQTRNFPALVDELLTQHYDRHYTRSLHRAGDTGPLPQVFVAQSLSESGIDALARTIALAHTMQKPDVLARGGTVAP